MKVRNTVFGLVGCAGLALMLGASVASAQVDACNVPDSEFNHLECYKIRDVVEPPYTFDLVANDRDFLPAQAVEKTCVLRRKADSLCIDVRTKNVDPAAPGDSQLECADGTPCAVDGDCTDGSFCTTNPRTSSLGDIPNAWDYLCYKVRCDSPSQPGLGVSRTVKDRFGQRQITLSRSWKMCVPILEKSSVP